MHTSSIVSAIKQKLVIPQQLPELISEDTELILLLKYLFRSMPQRYFVPIANKYIEYKDKLLKELKGLSYEEMFKMYMILKSWQEMREVANIYRVAIKDYLSKIDALLPHKVYFDTLQFCYEYDFAFDKLLCRASLPQKLFGLTPEETILSDTLDFNADLIITTKDWTVIPIRYKKDIINFPPKREKELENMVYILQYINVEIYQDDTIGLSTYRNWYQLHFIDANGNMRFGVADDFNYVPVKNFCVKPKKIKVIKIPEDLTFTQVLKQVFNIKIGG